MPRGRFVGTLEFGPPVQGSFSSASGRIEGHTRCGSGTNSFLEASVATLTDAVDRVR